VRELDRWQRGTDVPFGDEYKPGGPIVPQIEAWATRHNVALQKPGWKVELAKRVKKKLLDGGVATLPASVVEKWAKLFETLQGVRSK
jgi:hypothetical protein